MRINSVETRSGVCKNCSQSRFCLPRNLNPDQVNTFERIIKSEKVGKGNFLYTPQSTQAAIYIVKSGSIKTYLSNQSGDKQVLGFHCSGDLAGFDSFYSGKHTCTAQALDDTFICKLELRHLEELYEKIPAIRNEIMQQAGLLIHHNHLMMLSLGKMQSDERLANFLIALSTRNSHRNLSAKKINLCMTRSDLASYLGIAIETLSRLFSQFQSKEIITVKLRTVEIINVKGLQDIAHRLHC